MARNRFGGVFQAWAVETVAADTQFGLGVQAVVLPTATTALQIYDAPDGSGNLVTDFQDDDNNPLGSIEIAVDDPYIPTFFGPDGVESLWIQSASGRWLPIPRYSTGQTGDALTLDEADALYLRADSIRPVVPLALRMRQVLWGGSAGHEWVNLNPGNEAAFNANDTSDFVYGSQSVYIQTAGTGLQTTVGRGDMPTSIDMTNGMPVVILKVDNPQAILDAKFVVGSSFADRWEWDLRETAGSPRYLPDGVWVPLTLSMGSVAGTFGTPNAAAVDTVYAYIFDNNTGVQVGLHWNLFGVADESQYPNGVLSITMDDGFLSQFTVARPYMDRHGIGATSFMIAETLYNEDDPAWINYFGLDQAHQLEDFSGWEMASHAFTAATHNAGYPSLPQDQQLADMRACRSYLNSEGFRAAEHFAYPLGQRNTVVERSVRQTFASGRTLNPITLESVPVLDPVRIRSWAPDNTVLLSAYQAKVDAAVASGDWLIVLFHDIVASPSSAIQTATATFQGFIDYAVASGIDIRLVSEVLR